MHVDQWLKIPLEELDAWTLAEIRGYVERKFLDSSAYTKLKAKYRASRRLSRKKLAILEDMCRHYCERRNDT